MNVTLAPDLEKFVREQVETGHYPSAEELVRDAVLRLKLDEKRHQISGDELRRLIAVGQAEADRGELLDSEEVFEELERHSAARRSQRG
ncbi:MAG TPA: type II toxin-antitoxin system ParD family antitoxin [Tepidisphaeraceae bacterium]|nr:type II toxin-antitoxin system ParD family antitoxin [Tepidisphaeraceae bacterium]